MRPSAQPSPDAGQSSSARAAWLRRAGVAALILIAALTLARWGLDAGTPEAPWGEEDVRRAHLYRESAELVLVPWRTPGPDAHAPAPWARWALPMMVLALGADLAAGPLRRRWRQQQALAAGGHAVLVGASPLVLPLAARWVTQGRAVVVIGADERSRAALESSGAVVLPAPVTEDDTTWQRAGLARASHLVLAGGNDVWRIEQAMKASAHVARHRAGDAPALQVMLSLDDPFLASGVERRLVEGRASDMVELRLWSAARFAARRLLRDGVAQLHRSGLSGDAAWLLVGAGPLAEALIVERVQTDVVWEQAHPVFVVVDPAAAEFVQRVQARWPGMQGLATLHALEHLPEQAAQACAVLVERGVFPAAVFHCDESAAHNVASALAWYAAWREQRAVVPAMFLHADMVPPLFGATPVRPFGATGPLAEEIVAGEALDAMARAVHERYLADALAHGAMLGERRSLQPWRQLPHDLRDDNRAVADHHAVKLRAESLALLEAPAGPLAFDGQTIERLARLEHERWMRRRLLLGWRWGPKRDDAALVHPDLVPYDELADARQELDREVVRQLPELLAQVGATAVPERRLLVAGPPSPWVFGAAFDERVGEVLASVYADVPVAAQVLWVVPGSAMAWRVAELWQKRGGRRLGLVLHEPLEAEVARLSQPELRERLQRLAAAAEQTLVAWPASSPAVSMAAADPESLRAWRKSLGADGLLALSIDGGATPALPEAWGLDAAGTLRAPAGEARA